MFTHSQEPPPLSPMPLRAHQIFRMEGWKGQRIECTEGHVWVTQDRDIRDIVLGAHEGFTFDRSGPVLVYALDRAQFRVESSAGVPGRKTNPREAALLASPATAGCAACY